ncbi:MAG: AcrR family transcriptional regulator [Sphingobacteriales bacterium]
MIYISNLRLKSQHWILFFEQKIMSIGIRISLNEGLYLKEPQESKLGRKIIQHSILLIEEFGFESFNFKKLAAEIASTEASIYRYFENKHLLLIFLVNWYWEWVNYLITINTRNVNDPREKLHIIINSFVSAPKENPGVEYVNESKLHNIVISEGVKAYHTKGVDEDNSKGFFKSYKNLANELSKVISEINPDFKYPFALATDLFEMSNNHIYYAKHLPRLTDISVKGSNVDEVEGMLNYFADKLLAE